jgi:hypothetical protein
MEIASEDGGGSREDGDGSRVVGEWAGEYFWMYNPHGACELVNDTGEFILGALTVKMRPASRHPVQASSLLR